MLVMITRNRQAGSDGSDEMQCKWKKPGEDVDKPLLTRAVSHDMTLDNKTDKEDVQRPESKRQKAS